MRIFGTISGKIRNQGIETYYREGEESKQNIPQFKFKKIKDCPTADIIARR